MQVQSITFDDFSGGITDYPMEARPNQAEMLDNLVLNPNKKPITRNCFQIFDTGAYQVLDGNVRIGSLLPMETAAVSTLFCQSSRKIWYESSGAFTELLGPVTSNPALPAGDTTNYVSSAFWNNHLYVTSDAFGSVMKIYHDATNTPQVRNSGLPDLATSPTVTAGGAGANSYIYAFIYYYTYTIGTVVFEDFGPTTQVALASALAPNASTVAITAIPVLANGATENRDTVNIKVKIYRTIASGTQFFYLGQVTNGTTVYNDSASDATIQTSAQLYINGGVLDNDPPPQCKFIHVVNGKAYYANIKDGTELLSNQVRESKVADPDSVPVDNFDEVEDEITGISSYKGKVVVFGKTNTYRLDGGFNELGQGGLTHEAISPIVGCISHLSIVQTRDGIFWAGNDGFYYTDGYNVQKVSDSLNITYKAFTSTTTKQKRIVGTYDKKENRVIWTVQNKTDSTDNDTLFILDLRWGVRADSTFTTATNSTHLAPTALCFFSNILHHGDRRGYIFKWSDTIFSDPLVDTSVAAPSWGTSTVLHTIKSIAIDFGLPQVRKWVTGIVFKSENKSNLSVQITSNNDDTSSFRQLKEIRFRDNCVWGDPEVVWSYTSTAQWGFTGLIIEKRRFPAGTLRCSYKQIVITNALTNIYKSDTYSTASVNSTTKVATLTNPSTFDFPSDILDYYISFDTDSYTANYKITAQTADTLTYQDALNATTSTTKKWLIRGYPKREVLSLLSYTLFYSPLTTTQHAYSSSTTYTGANS